MTTLFKKSPNPKCGRPKNFWARKKMGFNAKLDPQKNANPQNNSRPQKKFSPLKKFNPLKKLSAIQILALGFLGLIIVGGLLLSLPIAARSGHSTPLLDSFFTATSAVCVTGLATVNTLAHWTTFGQVVILTLIQIGGLGFMSLPVLVYLVLGKKVQFSTRVLLKEALNLDELSGTVGLMRYIIRLSLSIQLLGAALLSVYFIPQFGLGKGVYYSIFHAISAYCNAGFDLLGDSLVPYQTSPYLLFVLSLLIIAGGLGFIVWRDVVEYKNKKRVSLHTKIALTVTGVLLAGAFVLFLVTETATKNIPDSATWLDKLANTWFMAVTPRTAGFYSVNYANVSHAGIFLTMLLMYVGGTSGSTAGGLKTTTFGILLIQMKSMFTGRTRAEVFGRTIRQSVVMRAFLLFSLGLTIVLTATTILTMTETIPGKMGIEYIAFEVISAFATVGLSMGLTPELSVVGKWVIMCLMYLGRVGIFTVGFSLLKKSQAQEINYKYPEENVLVG